MSSLVVLSSSPVTAGAVPIGWVGPKACDEEDGSCSLMEPPRLSLLWVCSMTLTADDAEFPDGSVCILCTAGGRAGSNSLPDLEVFPLSGSGGSTLDFIIDFLLDLDLEPEECNMSLLLISRK